MLLVTGKCDAGCYYCPLSPEKTGKEIIFANELKVERDQDIITEAKLIGSTGTGVTGGEPLMRPAETARLIRLLKDRFGEKHHVHLYTASSGIKAISMVVDAGLDELRFHPPLSKWKRLRGSGYDRAITFTGDRDLDVGIEIPSIPGMEQETRALLEFAADRELKFVNLNELEFSEANWRALRRRGFDVKDEISSAVKGSEEMSIRLLSEARDALPVHYCSSSFKDGIQLRRRIMRRGKRIRRALDILTEDGTLIMGIVETDHPEKLALEITERFSVPDNLICPNERSRRVEIASWVLEEIAPELKEDSFIIEEYPTADRLEVERERIGGSMRR